MTAAAAPPARSCEAKAGLYAAIRQHGRAALVVNTRSRRGQRLYPAVRARLHAAGLDLLGSFPTGRPGGLDAALTAAIGLQPDLLIVGGGDGTICEAARRLAHRDMALGLHVGGSAATINVGQAAARVLPHRGGARRQAGRCYQCSAIGVLVQNGGPVERRLPCRHASLGTQNGGRRPARLVSPALVLTRTGGID